MSGARLVIDDLRGGIPGQDIIRGLSLEVPAGEVHAVMGPNGSGKSTLASLLVGRPGYAVTGGRVSIEADGDQVDLLALPTWKRVHAGLFLALQHPVEVPGVSLVDALVESFRAGGRPDGGAAAIRDRLEVEADRIGFDRRFLDRPLNVDLSGGERKRNETIQLGVLRPRFAVIDEIDSGLDVDALQAVSRRIEAATTESGLGVLVITHFARLLHVLRADRIHVLLGGRIVASGGAELAEELERSGYAAFADGDAGPEADTGPGSGTGRGADAGPTTTPNGSAPSSDPDPFADPLAGL